MLNLGKKRYNNIKNIIQVNFKQNDINVIYDSDIK